MMQVGRMSAREKIEGLLRVGYVVCMRCAPGAIAGHDRGARCGHNRSFMNKRANGGFGVG